MAGRGDTRSGGGRREKKLSVGEGTGEGLGFKEEGMRKREERG